MPVHPFWTRWMFRQSFEHFLLVLQHWFHSNDCHSLCVLQHLSFVFFFIPVVEKGIAFNGWHATSAVTACCGCLIGNPSTHSLGSQCSSPSCTKKVHAHKERSTDDDNLSFSLFTSQMLMIIFPASRWAGLPLSHPTQHSDQHICNAMIPLSVSATSRPTTSDIV